MFRFRFPFILVLPYLMSWECHGQEFNGPFGEISCRFDTYAFQMAHSALGPVFLRDVMICKVLSFDNQSC